MDLFTIIGEHKTKPFLKWAGGKTQILEELKQYIPTYFNRYLEPFIGGGALFFYLKPKNAILSDSNVELINAYNIVKSYPLELIDILKKHKNNEIYYYKIRSLEPDKLGEIERAARFIYLNKTCFNGLNRVNKKGEFNVPFGHYKNPKIVDEERLLEASKALQNAKIISGDYKAVLRRYAQEKDFIYLDPPYHPVGGYSDFQRYTKEFFYEEDHIELRNEFNRLVKIGARVLLTNSNTPFVNGLFSGHDKKVLQTKRLISSKAGTRTGIDLIVSAINGKRSSNTREELLENFPGTRYMGSKYKILPFLWDSIKQLDFTTALDAFSGSGCVSYMFKQKGIETYSNDFLTFTSNIAYALIENNTTRLNDEDIKLLLKKNTRASDFISKTFEEIYFSYKDNLFLDNLRANIELLKQPAKKAIAIAAASRACMKKRPRGIFTYIGQRYDDGRKDIQLSLTEHFLESVDSFNQAVFNNGRNNKVYNLDVFDLNVQADLVYFDPPYLTNKSDNDYTRRYHFVEGFAKNWKGLEIQENTLTKKFKKYPSPFDSKNTVNKALDTLFDKYKSSILVVSYSSNSIPQKEEMIKLLKRHKKKVELKELDYKYSFGNQSILMSDSNKVKEYLFIARNE